MAAHCAMHPNIIVQMITTPCDLDTPCVSDAMAAHCAIHPTIIIQMIYNTMRVVTNSMCFRCHGSTLCHASKHNHSDGYNTMRAVANSMCFRCRGSTLCLAFNIIIQMITTPCELQTPWVFDAMAAHCAMHPKHNHSDDYHTMRITNSCVFNAMAAHCAM